MDADGTTGSGIDLGKLRIARAEETPAQVRATGLRRRSALIYLTLGLMIAGSAAYGIHAYHKSRLPTVQTTAVFAANAGQPSVVLTGSGYVVTSHKYITIGTKILGQIVSEPIQEGQYIKKGDVLARIDDRDYQAQLRQALATEEVAEADVRLMRSKAERAKALYGKGVESQDAYETAANAADVADATLKSDAAAVDYARFMVSQCVIRSPIDGLVLQKYREVGDTINYGGALQAGGGATDIAQLADTGDMRVQVDINETDIAKVAPGSRASVVLDAYPDKDFAASLVKIYPAADRQKGTVRVEVHIEDPDLHFMRPEMGARVSFQGSGPVSRSTPVITVPTSSVKTEGGASSVWIVRGSVVHKTPVVVGNKTELEVEVRSGLSDGDQVVISSSVPLSEGQAVKIDTKNPISNGGR